MSFQSQIRRRAWLLLGSMDEKELRRLCDIQQYPGSIQDDWADLEAAYRLMNMNNDRDLQDKITSYARRASNRCSKCRKEATYDHPAKFCDEHWVDWWFEGDKRPRRIVEKEKRQMLKEISQQP